MVSDGLSESEFVLRGGGLKFPTVLPARLHEGRLYVTLSRDSHMIHELLTDQKLFHRLLANSGVFAALASARQEARMQALTAAFGPKSAEEMDEGKEDLGIDGAPAAQLQRWAAKKGNSLGTVAAELRIELEGDEPWTPRVLLDSARAAIAMEASTENFRTLRRLVQAELQRPRAADRRLIGGSPGASTATESIGTPPSDDGCGICPWRA